MDDEKGKGRATDKDDGDEESSTGQSSMLSRVAVSATGLTRSAFASPTNNELNRHVTAALAEAGKGQVGESSSPSGKSAWAESSKGQQQPVGQANSASAFRAGHSEEHIRKSEDEFSSFLNDIDSFTPSESTGGGHFVSGNVGDGLDEAWARSLPVSSLLAPEPAYGSIIEQQNRDGEDVLAILSQSSALQETFDPPQEDENYNWGALCRATLSITSYDKGYLPFNGGSWGY